jgi:hypothetical protein
MRKMMFLAVIVALAVLMLAASPALAQDNDRNNRNEDRNEERNNNSEDREFGNLVEELCDDRNGNFICDFDEYCEDIDGNLICDVDELCEDLDGDLFCDEKDVVDGFGDFTEEFFQTSEQEADSGEFDQAFDITGGGDNSNQCVGAQGVGNTGNAQISLNVLNLGGEIDDFELEDLESSLTISPENSTSCDQEVNQAASAFGGYDDGGYSGGGY